MNANSIDKTWGFLITISILLLGISALAATLLNASGEVGNSGLPLAALFSGSNAVVLLAIMGAIVIAIVAAARMKGGRR